MFEVPAMNLRTGRLSVRLQLTLSSTTRRSVNRLAAVARKHGCPEVAKQIIATQYGFNAMEVQEAFVKITEQAKASLEQPRLYMEGVNLLSSQNLDYFTNTHQVIRCQRLH